MPFGIGEFIRCRIGILNPEDTTFLCYDRIRVAIINEKGRKGLNPFPDLTMEHNAALGGNVAGKENLWLKELYGKNKPIEQ